MPEGKSCLHRFVDGKGEGRFNVVVLDGTLHLSNAVVLLPSSNCETLFFMAESVIISKLPSSFDKALSSGDLIFFPSTVHKHSENGVEVRLRFYDHSLYSNYCSIKSDSVHP